MELTKAQMFANWLETAGADFDCNAIAAELRRLSAIEAERDRYKAHIEAQTKELDELILMAEKLEDEHYTLRAEVNEQARLNGMGAERELRLMAERDAARGKA